MQAYNHGASDGVNIHCYRWETPTRSPKAFIHLAHGMGEHAARYDWTAQKLTAAGYAVTANDHRAHGHTAEMLGDFGPNGWHRTLEDLHEILLARKAENPDIPLILFGHSMGSMMSQQYIARFGKTLDAVILSGSPGAGNRFQMWLVHSIARFERWRLGGQNESALLQTLLFGNSNKNFDSEPESTGYEWLSRDRQQVQAYIDDPLCGFVPCPRSICDLFEAERANWRPDAVGSIPTDLPVYLFSGTADPVHNELKNINRLLGLYRAHGLRVTTHFYPNGRHEMLNEINREEVIEDLLNWLGKIRHE